MDGPLFCDKFAGEEKKGFQHPINCSTATGCFLVGYEADHRGMELFMY